jgi:hypothetical protein
MSVRRLRRVSIEDIDISKRTLHGRVGFGAKDAPALRSRAPCVSNIGQPTLFLLSDLRLLGLARFNDCR